MSILQRIFCSISAVLLCSSSSVVIAGSELEQAAAPFSFPTLNVSALKAYHPKFVVELGWFSMFQGKSQNINIETLIGDYFSVSQHVDRNGLVGLGYYIDGHQLERFNLFYGINAFFLAKARVNGTIFQEQAFENLAYAYSTTQYPIYAAAKAVVNHTFYKRFNLTVDGGIGPNIIKTTGVSQVALDDITIPEPLFSGKTTAAFSAMLGAGVKMNHVFGDAPLECGYRFFYLGQGHFTKQNNQLIDTLKTGQGYANTVLCTVTV